MPKIIILTRPFHHSTFPSRTYIVCKGGIAMNSWIFLFLACILSGFALIEVPLTDTFLASLSPFTTVVGILTVLIFSLILIYKGVRYLFTTK